MPSSVLPILPGPCAELPGYIKKHPNTSMIELLQPYRSYEAHLRELFAQEPNHEALRDPYVNVLPLYTNGTCQVTVRARDPDLEPKTIRERYIMPLPEDLRRPAGSPAVVQSFKDFKRNFNLFSESSLAEMNWDNVVAAGSSVVNCILPVPKEFNGTMRAVREFYHEKFCPASDVDLFLYGLTEERAIAKIKEIETSIRDSILAETTTVRTKHAITICSQYPTRHVQIVLRIYKSVSEILTGFDIDCSGAAYDGKQVYCTPRALQSYITQINHIDLSRRSPSYENRLSKYSHRGFEVYLPTLERSRIDPTIYERSFQRTVGLARLLVLEKLPTTKARDFYKDKRREQRGRPPLDRYRYTSQQLSGNIKDEYEDEVAEWFAGDDVSNYHTFTLPYGPRFDAKRIEKLCYTRDLLLNSEWNQPDDRYVYLHRHPAFFGRVEDIIHDCCGFCPAPETDEELAISEKEDEIYIFGDLSFVKDNPGRQQIGSFNPITGDDWTKMAYISNTTRLCQAIVNQDLEQVKDWLTGEGANPNTRDHTGRAPLHLAVICSTPAVVQCLVDHGARLVARLTDGRTALHLAAERGDLEIVKILMEKSTANQAAVEERRYRRRRSRVAAARGDQTSSEAEESGEELLDDESYGESYDESCDEEAEEDYGEDGERSIASGSFVKVRRGRMGETQDDIIPEEREDGPDYYTIDVVAWDTPCSALHFAIISGHEAVVNLLCREYGADILLPIEFHKPKKESIPTLLTLMLALTLPPEKAASMVKTLLRLGATSAQSDIMGFTAFHHFILKNTESLIQVLWDQDKAGCADAINRVAFGKDGIAITPLQSAIANGRLAIARQLLNAGALPQIDFPAWLKSAKWRPLATFRWGIEKNQQLFEITTDQPLIVALRSRDPSITLELLNRGADPNTLTADAYRILHEKHGYEEYKKAALDIVREDLATLRNYSSETVATKEPKLPAGFDNALRAYKPGTWQHWVVANDIEDTKNRHYEEMEKYEKARLRIESVQGLAEKKAKIYKTVAALEEIELALLEKGAKTFEEMHGDVKANRWRPAQVERPQDTQQDNPKEYKFDFMFYWVHCMTEAKKQAYVDLFEAAWDGKLEEIKRLTLNSENPLKIAVSCCDNTPFSLAFFRGHYTVAKAILEICQAQYTPEDSDTEDSEDGGGDNAESVLYRDIIDEQYTIEKIGRVSMKVLSHERPQKFMNEWCSEIVDGKAGKSGRLLISVIKQNNLKALKFLIDIGEHFSSHETNNNPGCGSYTFPDYDFVYAIQHGRVDLLPEIIRRTGAGLPLEKLVESTGLEITEKPRYYQGLSVYGQKRRDWATAGRRVAYKRAGGTSLPPPLLAALAGSIESVEWFLSDAPMRHYLDFANSKSARDDPRLNHLRESPGGVDGAISTWLDDQSHLIIHAAILGPPKKGAKLVDYLVRACPSLINSKSQDGVTPLALACRRGSPNIVRALLDNGADPTTHDSNWNNILHQALRVDPPAAKLGDILELLNPDVRTRLLRERNNLRSSGTTPLHTWIYSVFGWFGSRFKLTNSQYLGEKLAQRADCLVETLKLLLSYSGGAELDMLDGAGDTPLHTLIAHQAPPELIRVVLNHNPRLLHRENAVGRTPAELARDGFIASAIAPPRIPRLGISGLAGRRPESFVQPSSPNPVWRIEERIWDLCRAYAGGKEGENESATEAALAPLGRRLVSLHEANDVAKRLGETYKRKHVGFSFVEKEGENGDDDEKKDIVAANVRVDCYGSSVADGEDKISMTRGGVLFSS